VYEEAIYFRLVILSVEAADVIIEEERFVVRKSTNVLLVVLCNFIFHRVVLCGPESVPTTGGGEGKPVQIIGVRWSGQGPGAPMLHTFCLSRYYHM
jgi:hypothetical protein